MTQVPVKVTGQGQTSPKWVKNQRTGHISDAISPTDFILGTKVQLKQEGNAQMSHKSCDNRYDEVCG